jgi:syringate O-demethylase/vanillate/3-O-methylgallate O-demethylase
MIRTLEDKIQAHEGSVADMLRNAQMGAYDYPMRSEWTNWRDEQRAWRQTCVLFDQSFHMTDVYFKGPDSRRLISGLGVNSFATFGAGKAKQFVACNDDGHVVGDAILFAFADDEFSLVGRPVVPNWVAWHAETGDYDVTVTRDERSVENGGRRLTFRYQLNGPSAQRVIERAVGRPLERIPFFNMGRFEIAGAPVRALNHTMAGFPGLEMTGLELMGPSEHGEAVLNALVEAGAEFGLKLGGGRAYPSTAVESGWIPSPVPAIYTGEGLKAYREWLPARGFEANASIGGSFVSDDIEDYYCTPWDLGYGRLVRFDHDFTGRPALEKLADAPHRRKVWLRWDEQDTGRVITESLFGCASGTGHAKYLDLPVANYTAGPHDRVLLGDRLIGVSCNAAYTVNIGSFASLAMVDEADAVDGAEVTVIVGEPDGGSTKPTVERHVQRPIRATLHTSPLV